MSSEGRPLNLKVHCFRGISFRGQGNDESPLQKLTPASAIDVDEDEEDGSPSEEKNSISKDDGPVHSKT
jgi:hypothetical protein